MCPGVKLMRVIRGEWSATGSNDGYCPFSGAVLLSYGFICELFIPFASGWNCVESGWYEAPGLLWASMNVAGAGPGLQMIK